MHRIALHASGRRALLACGFSAQTNTGMTIGSFTLVEPSAHRRHGQRRRLDGRGIA